MVDCGEKSVGAVLGFSKVAVYVLSAMIDDSALKALVSPPRWGEVAALMPSSERVGIAKSPLGPERAL